MIYCCVILSLYLVQLVIIFALLVERNFSSKKEVKLFLIPGWVVGYFVWSFCKFVRDEYRRIGDE
jgi:hypothetical protein